MPLPLADGISTSAHLHVARGDGLGRQDDQHYARQWLTAFWISSAQRFGRDGGQDLSIQTCAAFAFRSFCETEDELRVITTVADEGRCWIDSHFDLWFPKKSLQNAILAVQYCAI
jgi:hypothetical protein